MRDYRWQLIGAAAVLLAGILALVPMCFADEEEPPQWRRLSIEIPTGRVVQLKEVVAELRGRVVGVPPARLASAQLFLDAGQLAIARTRTRSKGGGVVVRHWDVQPNGALVVVASESKSALDFFYSALRADAGLALRHGRWKRKTGAQESGEPTHE